MLFITFIVVTAFIFANLIIAVICDAVHVLGNADVAHLLGCDEEVTGGHGTPKSNTSKIHKLRELNMQVDHVVTLTNYLSGVLKELGDKSENRVCLENDFVNESFDENMHDVHDLQIFDLSTKEDLSLCPDEVPKMINHIAHPESCSLFSELSPTSLNETDNGHSMLDPQCRKQDDVKRVSKQSSLLAINDKVVEHIHECVDNPRVKFLNDLRKFIGKCVNDDRVQAFILALIVINAIMMGVATFPFVKENPNISSMFDLIDQIFLIIFTIEAAMQLSYHGWTFLKDPWLVFDVTIVALSWALEGVKVARAFRIFRALRLVARIGVMKNLIIAVVSVIPNLTAIIMLLCLVFYIFAVMFTQLYKDVSKQYPRTQQYFVGLPETYFTLFQMMTLVSWLKHIFICDDISCLKSYKYSKPCFILFRMVGERFFNKPTKNTGGLGCYL